MLRTTFLAAGAATLAGAGLALQTQTSDGEQTRIDAVESDPAAIPAGLWWADFDGDGLRDAYAVDLNGQGHLIQNAGDGTFRDVTQLSGLDAIASPNLALWHDFDGDGHEDLFIGTQSGASHLMRNAADGTFQDITIGAGLSSAQGVLWAEVLDYDKDGLADLVVRTTTGDSVFHATSAGSFEELDLGLPQPATRANAAPQGREGGSPATNTGPGREGKAAADQGRSARGSASTSSNSGRRPVGNSGNPVPPQSSSSGPGSVGPFSFALPICADTIVDQTAPATCLEADSTPTLGRLYPLSTDFNLDPASGSVRMGTTAAVTDFQLLVDASSTASGSGAVFGLGMNGPTEGHLATQGDTDFNGITSADWSGFEIGVAGLSVGASSGDNYGVMGHSNFVGVRGEHSGSPSTDFAELGLSGIGISASGSTAAGEFDGTVNVRDGLGNLAAAIVPSATGTSNDIELYQAGTLSVDHATVSEGHQHQFRNTVTSGLALVGGVSAVDDSGFWQVQSLNGSNIVWLDADNDQSNDGVASGAVNIRSLGTGGPGGELDIQNNSGSTRINAFGGASSDGGFMDFFNSVGGLTWRIDGEAGSGGTLTGTNDAGIGTVFIDTDSGGGAFMQLENDAGAARISLDGDSSDGGTALVSAADGSSTVFIDGEAENSGGAISVRHDVSSETIRLVGDRVSSGSGSQSGLISMWDRNGSTINSVVIEAEDDFSTGSQIRLEGTTAGNTTVELDGSDGLVGQLRLSEVDGSAAFQMLIDDFTLYNGAGLATQNYDRETGSKSAVVGTDNYGRRLLYAMESPGVWFEDFGSARLSGGRARVDVDPMFLETVTVNDDHPMKVFITLTGESKGVWVEKGVDHFVVHELAGGTGNATFDWRLVAKRRGLETARLDSWDAKETAMKAAADLDVPARTYAPSDGEDAPPTVETRQRQVVNPDKAAKPAAPDVATPSGVRQERKGASRDRAGATEERR